MTSHPLIAFEHVGREFDGGRIVALKDVNLEIAKGESLSIVGASGSGKTTLIMLMCGIMAPIDRRGPLERRAGHDVAGMDDVAPLRDRHRVPGLQPVPDLVGE